VLPVRARSARVFRCACRARRLYAGYIIIQRGMMRMYAVVLPHKGANIPPTAPRQGRNAMKTVIPRFAPGRRARC